MSTQKLTIAPHIRHVRVEGDFVLMDLENGTYLGLDPVASQIWQSLDEHGDLQRAAEEVCQNFEVEFDHALADAEKWVAEMVSKGLLRSET